MKKIKLFIFALLLMLPVYVFAAGDVSVSPSSVTVDVGGTATFKIKATNAAGRVTISSTDTTIATVDKSSEWVENDGGSTNTEVTVTVTGVKAGSASVNVVLTDVATFDEEELTGTKKVTVTVSGEKSSNNNLTDLKVDGVTVTGFSSSTTAYTVATDKTSVDITATKEDSKATVTGTGTKTLNYGENKVNIKVTAENGSSKTYVLTINRNDTRDNNAYLSALGLEEANISFKKDTLTYNVEVENAIDSVIIFATPESSSANVDGTGLKTLNVGSNVFNVVVTAQNGEKKTYTISVVRAAEPVTGNTVTITYNSNGGSACVPASKEVTIGNAIGELCTPTRKGYTFNGWFTSTVGGTKITATTPASENKIMYAQWKLDEKEPTPVNPKTGISTPIIALGIVAIISAIAFFIVKKKNSSVDFQ